MAAVDELLPDAAVATAPTPGETAPERKLTPADLLLPSKEGMPVGFFENIGNAALGGVRQGGAQLGRTAAYVTDQPAAEQFFKQQANLPLNTPEYPSQITDPTRVSTPIAQTAGRLAPMVAGTMLAPEFAGPAFIAQAGIEGPLQAQDMNEQIRAAKAANPDDPKIQALKELDPGVAGLADMARTAMFMKGAGLVVKQAVPAIRGIESNVLRGGAQLGAEAATNLATGAAMDVATMPTEELKQTYGSLAGLATKATEATMFAVPGGVHALPHPQGAKPIFQKTEVGRGLEPAPVPPPLPTVPSPTQVKPELNLIPQTTAAVDTAAVVKPPPLPAQPPPVPQTPTVPESAETLKLQQEQIVKGLRPAMMFTKGEDVLPLPQGMEAVETPNDIFHFDPKKITAEQVQALDAAGRQNEMLNLGSQSKADIEASGQPAVVVTERKGGVEIRAAGATADKAPATAQEMERQKTPGSTIAIEAPHEVLLDRTLSKEELQKSKVQDLIDALESGKLPAKQAKAVQRELTRRSVAEPGAEAVQEPVPPQTREDRITMLQAELGTRDAATLDKIQALAERRNWAEDKYLAELEKALEKARVPAEPTQEPPPLPQTNEQKGQEQAKGQPGAVVQPGKRPRADTKNKVRVEPGHAKPEPGAGGKVRGQRIERPGAEGRPVPKRVNEPAAKQKPDAGGKVRRVGKQRAGAKEQPVLETGQTAAEQVLPRPGSLATPEGRAAVKTPEEKRGKAPKKTIAEYEEDLNDLNPDVLGDLQKDRGDNGWDDAIYQQHLKGAINREAKSALPPPEPTVDTKAPVTKPAVQEKKPARGGPRKGSLAAEAVQPKAEPLDLRREKFKVEQARYDKEIAKEKKLAKAAKESGDKEGEQRHRKNAEDWLTGKAEHAKLKNPDTATERQMRYNRENRAPEEAKTEESDKNAPVVQAHIDAYRADFPDAPPIITVHSDNLEQVVSPEIAEQVREDDKKGTTIRAFVDPQTGRTILFHNRMGGVSGKEMRMIFHEETIGHYGLEGALRNPGDKDAFKREMDIAFNKMVAEGGPLARDFAKRVQEYVGVGANAHEVANNDVARRQVMAEVIAHNAGEHIDKPWLQRAWDGMKRIFDTATLGKLDLMGRDDYMQRLVDAGRRYNQERAAEFGADNNYTPEERNEIRANRAEFDRSAQQADEAIPFKRKPSSSINEAPALVKGKSNAWTAESALDHLRRRNVPSASDERTGGIDEDAFKGQERAAYQAFSKAGRLVDESFGIEKLPDGTWAWNGDGGEHNVRYDPATNRWFKFNKPGQAGLRLVSPDGSGELGLGAADLKDYLQRIKDWNEEVGDDTRVHGMMKFGTDYVLVTSQPHIESGFPAPERMDEQGNISDEYKQWHMAMESKIDDYFTLLGYERIGDNAENGYTFLLHDAQNPENSRVFADISPRNAILDTQGNLVLIDGAMRKGPGPVLDQALKFSDEIMMTKRTPDDETIPLAQLQAIEGPQSFTASTPTQDFIKGMRDRGLTTGEINSIAEMTGYEGVQRELSPTDQIRFNRTPAQDKWEKYMDKVEKQREREEAKKLEEKGGVEFPVMPDGIGGWLDPHGEFHPLNGDYHDEDARQHLKAEGDNTFANDTGLESNFGKPTERLAKRGWIRIPGYSDGVNTIIGGQYTSPVPNKPQLMALQAHAEKYHQGVAIDMEGTRRDKVLIRRPLGDIENLSFNRKPIEQAHEKYGDYARIALRRLDEGVRNVRDSLKYGLDARDNMAANEGRRAENEVEAHIAANGGTNRNAKGGAEQAKHDRNSVLPLMEAHVARITTPEEYQDSLDRLRGDNLRIQRGLASSNPKVVEAMKILEKPYADALNLLESNPQRALAWAGKVKQEFDAQFSAREAAGLDPHYFEDYVKRLLEQGQDLESAYAMPGSGGGAGGVDTSNKQSRRFRTLVDAAEQGKKVASMDVAGLVGAGQAETTKAINNQELFDKFRNTKVPGFQRNVIEDGRKVFNPLTKKLETKAPDGPYVSVDGPNGQKLWVDSEFAPFFGSMFRESYVRNNALLSAALHTAADLKHGILLFDTFHVGRVMARLAFLLAQARGGKGLANLDIPAEILNKLGIRSVSKYGKGRAALDFRPKTLDTARDLGWITDADKNWAMQNQALVHMAESTGFNVAGNLDNLYERSGAHGLLNQILHEFGTERIKGAPKLSVGEGIETFNKWVFQKMTRNAMMIGWKEAFERNQKRFSEKSQEEIARITSKEMNEYFGNLGRQGLFSTATAQDMARLIFLAPQWANSMIASQGRGLAQAGALLHPERRPGNVVGAMASGWATMFVANQVINMITKGRPTWDNEEGHKTEAYIPGGKNGFYLSPLSLVGEEFHTAQRYMEGGTSAGGAAARILSNKFSPMMRAQNAVNPIVRRDSMLRPIKPGEELGTAARALMPVPIFASGATGSLLNPEMAQKGDIQRQLFGMAGLKIDRAQSPGQKLRSMGKELIPESFSKDESPGDYAPLRAYINNDHESKAKAEVLDLLRKGKTIGEIIRAFAPKPIGGSAERQGLLLQRGGEKAVKLLGLAAAENAQGQDKIGKLLQSMSDKELSAAIEAGMKTKLP